MKEFTIPENLDKMSDAEIAKFIDTVPTEVLEQFVRICKQRRVAKCQLSE